MNQKLDTDRKKHRHGSGKMAYEHKHAWASIEHLHILRGLCRRPECQGTAFHNIHPGPEHEPEPADSGDHDRT